MINLKKVALATLFVASSAFAQESGVKGFLTNDASIGVNVGIVSFLSDINPNLGFGVTYTKNLNAIVGLQAGLLNGTLSRDFDNENSDLELVFTGFSARGIINLSNLSTNVDNNLKYYAVVGASVLNFKEDVSTIATNFGGGVKFHLNDNLDFDFSGILSFAELGKHMMPTVGVNYRFMKKEEALEWNNPLDAMYGDIATVKTEIEGLSTDSDGDGVADAFDADNNTPEGVAVDGKGNALDVDMDGVADYADEDPFTARGVQVDAKGRELDSDKDGVANSVDIEPNTPAGATVNFLGKEIRGAKGAFMPAVYFDFNSAKVSYANYERLAAVASLLQANPNYKLRVIGYADTFGNSENNHKVALRRANAVIDALTNMFSVDASRLTAESKGEDAPLANESVKVTETTADGQVISNSLTRMNRRVEFVIE